MSLRRSERAASAESGRVLHPDDHSARLSSVPLAHAHALCEHSLMNLGQPVDLGASGVRKRLDAFRRHVPLMGDRLLDLGCGNGAYTQELARGFGDVDAVDVQSATVADFQRRICDEGLGDNIEVRVMAGEHLDFPDSYFDAVTCIEVLEHVNCVAETISEVRRVLRPGGLFLLTVPNRAFPFETHMVTIGEYRFPGRRLPGLPYLPQLHERIADARTYTGRSLRRILTRGGFVEVATDYVMPPFDRWKAGRRYLKPVVDLLETGPARVLGVSVVGVYRKPSGVDGKL